MRDQTDEQYCTAYTTLMIWGQLALWFLLASVWGSAVVKIKGSYRLAEGQAIAVRQLFTPFQIFTTKIAIGY